MTARTAALLALAVALTGCGSGADVGGLEPLAATGSVTTATSTPAATPTPTGPAASSAVPQQRDALGLVGRWHVEGPGIAPRTALVLGERMAVFLPCGVLDGGWGADGDQGLFLAASSSGDGTCFAGASRVPLPWLEGARGFDVDADGHALLGPDGEVLARLRPGARPTTGPDRSDTYADDPQVTPALRARLARPAPLPEGARAPTPQALQRRWRPVGVSNEKAHLLFAADGAYTGSDGCNGQGGRYALGGEGRLLGTSGPQTLIGCEGAPVGGWVDGAARAGLVDGQLVLYDDAGAVLGRLDPA